MLASAYPEDSVGAEPRPTRQQSPSAPQARSLILSTCHIIEKTLRLLPTYPTSKCRSAR